MLLSVSWEYRTVPSSVVLLISGQSGRRSSGRGHYLVVDALERPVLRWLAFPEHEEGFSHVAAEVLGARSARRASWLSNSPLKPLAWEESVISQPNRRTWWSWPYSR